MTTILELPTSKQAGYRYYDNSMLDKFRACPRSFFFRHYLDWIADETKHDLVFGLCWHAAMDIVWRYAGDPKIDDITLQALAMAAFMETWYTYYPADKEQLSESIFSGESEDERFPKMPGRANDMLAHYIRRKRADLAKYKVLGIETPFIVPLPEFTNTFYVGRKDKTYETEEGVKDVDHKTTKTDGDVWKDTFFPNSQMDGYLYSGYLVYGDRYKGVEIDGALCQKGSAKSAREDYPPGIGFSTVPIRRDLSFVESWLWDTTYLIKQLDAHFDMLASCKPEDDFLKAFEKHTTGCGYYKGCEYRPICKFYENPLRFEGKPPRGYKVEKWSPFDLVDITKQVVD